MYVLKPLLYRGMVSILPFRHAPPRKRESMRIFKIIVTIADLIFLFLLTLAVMFDKRDHRASFKATYLIIMLLHGSSLIGMWL